MKKNVSEFIFITLKVTFIYWFLSCLNFLLFKSGGILPMPVWPASGYAIAISYRFNGRALLGLFLGAMLSNAVTLQSGWYLATIIATMNAFAPFIVVYIINILTKKRNPFQSISDFAVFIILAVIIHPAITASGGIFGRLLLGTLPKEAIVSAWQNWWLAHSTGTMLFAPILLLIYFPNKEFSQKKYEYIFLSLITIISVFLIFTFEDSVHSGLPFLLIIPMSFIAIQYSMLSTMLLSTIVSIIGMIGIVINPLNEFGDATAIISFRIMTISYSILLLLLSIIRKMQNQSETLLRESEKNHRMLVARMPDIFMRFDNLGKFIFVSDNVENIIGVSGLTCLGKTPREIGLSESNRKIFENSIERVFKTGQSFETECIFDTPKGKVISNSRLFPEYDNEKYINSVLIIMRDITEHRKVEQDYKMLFNEMLDGFALHEIILDEKGYPINYRFIAVNPAFERMTGLKSENILSKTVLEVLPNTEKYWIETYGKVAITGEPLFFENYSKALNKYFAVTAFSFASNQFACIFSDITRRKQAEDDLRKAEEKYRILVNYSQSIIYTIASDGIISFVSPSWTAILGHEQNEVIGQNFQKFVHKDDLSFCNDRFSSAINNKKTVPEGTEYRILHKDGSIRWHRSIFQVVCDEQDHVIMLVGNGIDITRRKKAEEEREKLQEQLNQAQKMESVGRLAGGVAHDFNNMLGVILGHAELVINRIHEKDPIFLSMQEIHKAGFRSAELTRQLLAFARKQTISPKIMNINEVIGGMLSMLQRLIGENIILNWHPCTNIWNVKMDSSQIDQILANLCVNARDAINDTGKITIETDNVFLDKTYCDSHLEMQEGEYVLLAVSDNGIGMSKETLALMFEPFFTTKAMHKGTGLGLATVYGIVKQNNAFINAYSEKDHGSTFKIYIPRYSELDISQAHNFDELTINHSGKESILVVEDETMILDVAKSILTHGGYNVLFANSPSEAIKIASTYDSEIHLILTDVVMPEMNGRELAQKISELYPHIKKLFMSGYTANVIAHHGVIKEGVNFIQKPFSMKDLILKVKQVLNSKA